MPPPSTSCAIPDPLRAPAPTASAGEDAREVLRLAADEAELRGHPAARAPHLLLALLEDPGVVGLMSELHCDLDLLDDELLATLDGLPRAVDLPEVDLGWIVDVAEAAAAAALGRRHRTFTAVDLLGAAVRRADARTLAILARAGVDRLALLRRLAGGAATTSTTAPVPGPEAACALVMHNDDYTTQDFVVDLLVEVFGHRPREAEDRMLAVHHDKSAVVFRGTCAEALERLRRVEQRCVEEGMPLLVTLELEEGAEDDGDDQPPALCPADALEDTP